MVQQKQSVTLYNILFPIWMLLLFPAAWLIILPGNFIIDSLVFIISLSLFKITDKKRWYRRYIFKIFSFGMIADILGTLYLLLILAVFEPDSSGDDLRFTFPGLVLSAVLIFVFHYFITFKKEERSIRFSLSLIFAVVTAPYTFLIPSSWIYG